MYDYITIERSYASGGNEIAKELAKRLGYRLYDHNVVVETCKQLNLPYNMISEMDEQVPVKTIFNVPGEKYLSMEEQIFNKEKEIIEKAAEEPGCIFVGRCASEILKEKKCLRVFITAPDAYRAKRTETVEKIPKDQVQKTMRKFDTKREKFFTTHSGAKWGSSDYFDIILNSETLGMETCVALLQAAAEK